MSLERTENAGNGEAGEGNPAARVVTVDHLDQGDGGYLGQVVEQFAPAGVAARELGGQRQVPFDGPGAQLGPGGMLAGQARELAQEFLGGHRPVESLAAPGVDGAVAGHGTLPGSPSARVFDSARCRLPRNDHGWFCEHRHDVNAYGGHAAMCRQGGQSLC